jgi:hypothetical protein
MPAQSKVISEKGVLSNQSDFEGWFWIVKRLANANEIWKYINPDDSERVDLDEPAAEPTASSAAAATVWKEKKKDYRSAKEGMAKLEKHITETLDAKLHGLLTPCATVAEQVKVLYDHFNQSITQRYLDAVQEYTTARKYSTRSQSVEDWCSDFQMAYNKAVRYWIPDVMDFRAQHDLLKVFHSVSPGYAATVASTVLSKEAEYLKHVMAAPAATTLTASAATPKIPTEVSILTLITNFLQTSFLFTTNKKTHGYAFATLNGEESPYKSNNNRAGGHKRSHSTAEGTTVRKTPCPCGDGSSHNSWWSAGPYIDHSLRSKDFKEDKAKTAKVKAWIGSNSARKDIVKNICRKNKRRKEDSGSIDIYAGDPLSDSDSRQHQSHAIFHVAFNNRPTASPLLYLWTLDPASNLHICNNYKDFTWQRPATDSDVVLAVRGCAKVADAW